MLQRLWQSNCSPIGLDMGVSSIKMVQFSREVGAPGSVIASGEYEFPAGLPVDSAERMKLASRAIRTLMDASPFSGNLVVSSLPANWVQYKNIRLPQMPAEERDEAVQWEAADRFAFNNVPHTVQYLDAGEVRHGDEVRDELILMAVADENLRRYMQMLGEANLNPIAIEPTPTALCRCFARTIRREADMKQVRVIVDMGMSVANVMVLRGNQIVFFKPIDIGGAKLHEAVAQHLELPLSEAGDLRRRLADQADDVPVEGDETSIDSNRQQNVRRAVHECTRPLIEELAREIGLCLRYYSVTFRGARPNQLLLCGGEAHDPLIARAISELLELEVKVAQPLDGINLSSEQVAIERRGGACEWSVAAGLALRQPVAAGKLMRGAA